MTAVNKAAILKNLQTDILRLQGFKQMGQAKINTGLGPLNGAFPNGTFPLGAVHEFLSGQKEDTASTCGFIAGLLYSLMGSHGATIWISSSRTLFPPALKNFGLDPDRFIFLDLQKEKEVLWAMEEALRCGALSAVIGEIGTLTFTASRRLQLAVEQSQVTGFVLGSNGRSLNPTACVSRWKVTPMPSAVENGLPGIGFPKWKVELLKIRNGKPGAWDIRWTNGKFVSADHPSSASDLLRKKAG